MSWMVKWPGSPVFVERAEGAHFTCVDGIDHIDLCLGDTGAMMGTPAPTVDSVTAQLARGITTMLLTEDAIAVSTGLSDRFGLPYWQFTLTATDANRHAIRYARHLTGRPKIVVHNYCPRLGRRDLRDAGRRRPHHEPPQQHRPAGGHVGDDSSRRVQRCRRPREGPVEGDGSHPPRAGPGRTSGSSRRRGLLGRRAGDQARRHAHQR